MELVLFAKELFGLSNDAMNPVPENSTDGHINANLSYSLLFR